MPPTPHHRSLDDRLSGEMSQCAALQTDLTNKVAAIAETTGNFDDKIATFVRTVRADFRVTKEELVSIIDEKIELTVEDGRARCREIVDRQDLENRKIADRITSLAR